MDTSVQIGSWLFDLSDNWVAATAIILILASPFILVAAWRRLSARNRYRAFTVMALNLLACITLFLLLTEPVREHLSTQNVVLVSEGADLSKPSSRSQDDVYIAPDALTDESDRQAMSNAHWLLDVGQLLVREPALAKVELLGYGLSEAQWQSMPKEVGIEYSAPALRGFTDMQWSRSLPMGSTLQLKGKYNAPLDKNIIELRLLDPADKLIEEKRVLNGDHFDFLVRPKSPGNLIYRLQAWRGDEQLSDEPLAVFVSNSPPQRILVEQSAPSYEIRQLKNYAANLGTTLTINSRISKGKAITQTVNLADGGESAFSPASLAASDWMIIDGRALLQLSKQASQWLIEAVDAGLGVLVLADESLLSDFDEVSSGLLKGFLLSANTDGDGQAIPQLINVPSFENELPLPVASMTLRDDTASNRPLDIIVASRSGAILLARRQLGSGQVAISLISQSHTWLTAGQRTSWSNYWAALSAAISRQRQDVFLLPSPDDDFFRLNQRVKICAFGESSNLSVEIETSSNPQTAKANSDSLRLALTADRKGSAQHCTWFWPRVQGWQQLTLLADDPASVLDQKSVYVYGNDQWAGQRQFENMLATLGRQALSSQSKDHIDAEKIVTEALNPFWLWLLFVITASLLWLERKLDWDA